MLEAELQRWLPQLEAVDLPLGLVLYESGEILSHVYFPTTAIVSLLYVMEDGGSTKIAVVGNEGVVGSCSWAANPRRAELRYKALAVACA